MQHVLAQICATLRRLRFAPMYGAHYVWRLVPYVWRLVPYVWRLVPYVWRLEPVNRSLNLSQRPYRHASH
jgi:hypothetical protein